MTTIQAIVFGIVLALMPSLVVLALLVWRESQRVDARERQAATRPFQPPRAGIKRMELAETANANIKIQLRVVR